MSRYSNQDVNWIMPVCEDPAVPLSHLYKTYKKYGDWRNHLGITTIRMIKITDPKSVRYIGLFNKMSPEILCSVFKECDVITNSEFIGTIKKRLTPIQRNIIRCYAVRN
jgi:hypothetical protein